MPNTFAPQQFLNRELGQLEFNRRVLAQAEDAAIPLLERLKYLCIGSSNLDEFFEIRVAGLMEQIKLGGISTGADGMSAHHTLKLVREQAHQLIEHQYHLFNTEITPALAAQGIKFLHETDRIIQFSKGADLDGMPQHGQFFSRGYPRQGSISLPEPAAT